MRGWVLLSCVCWAACAAPIADPVATETTPAIASAPVVVTEPTSTTASDTASYAAYRPPAVKRPAGVYEFVLPVGDRRIRHTVSFGPGTYRLQEEFLDSDSVVITKGTWAPSQGFVWLYKDEVVRGRYAWEDGVLHYVSPGQSRRFPLTQRTPAASTAAWVSKQAEGALFYGIGTEPFWSVEVTRHDSALLRFPEWEEPLQAKLSLTTLTPDSTVYQADEDSLRIVIWPRFCTDGMSELAYSNQVKVYYKGKAYRGCGASF